MGSSIKEMKNAPSALLSYISTRDFSKNTRDFSSEKSQMLMNSAMYGEKVFYFFYKMYRELRALVLMT